MNARKSRMTGFTLVEILIVVVILGILAAIVIPQFTNASESAKAGSLVTQLQSLRSQLELYQVQHNGVYPNLIGTTAAAWDQFTKHTDTAGNITTTGGKTDVFKWGPYMQQPVRNAFEDSTVCAAAAAAGVGWQYDQLTGEIFAVLSTATAQKIDMADSAGANKYPNDIVLY